MRDFIIVRNIKNPSQTKEVGRWAANNPAMLKASGWELADPNDAVVTPKPQAEGVAQQVKKKIVAQEPKKENHAAVDEVEETHTVATELVNPLEVEEESEETVIEPQVVVESTAAVQVAEKLNTASKPTTKPAAKRGPKPKTKPTAKSK